MAGLLCTTSKGLPLKGAQNGYIPVNVPYSEEEEVQANFFVLVLFMWGTKV